MSEKPVQLQIPFASLINAIASLGFEEKRRLRQLLDEEIAQLKKTSPHNVLVKQLSLLQMHRFVFLSLYRSDSRAG